jgi:signal transduction histidine kinase
MELMDVNNGYFVDTKDVFNFIVAYKQLHDGNSPTWREISSACNISSVSVVAYILKKLEDQGKIILEHNSLPQIFERFYRGSQAREQSHAEIGLGLAVTKSIVETHGGSINVETEGQGKGSTFTILLSLSG